MEEGRTWDPLRRKEVALTPEEGVRQWFIRLLHEEAGVPLHRMMSEAPMKLGAKSMRADILVYGSDSLPLAVVECKRPDVEIGRRTLEQAARYDLVLGVRYIFITNGTRSYVFGRGSGGAFRPLDRLPLWTEMNGTAQI